MVSGDGPKGVVPPKKSNSEPDAKTTLPFVPDVVILKGVRDETDVVLQKLPF